MQLIDLSHTVRDHGRNMTVFSPKYAPRLSVGVSREESQEVSHLAPDVSYEVTHYSLMGSCGTYLDAPYHFVEQGADLATLPLQKLVLPGQILDCTMIPPRGGITAEFFMGQKVRPGHAILLRTDFSKYWGTEEYRQNPFLTESGVTYLVDHQVGLVGIDGLIIDDIGDGHRPAHQGLLGAGIPIVENLCYLDQVPSEGFYFVAVPPKFERGTAFVVRAFAFWFKQ
jgi:kynurenine formamidase